MQLQQEVVRGLATREQVVAAIVKTVADHGYRGFTIERALENADIPRATFDEHFESPEQALLAAQEWCFDQLWQEVAVACGTATEWPFQVRAVLRAVLNLLVEASRLARAFGVEATATSLVAVECQFTLLDRFAAMMRDGRSLYPVAASLPEATERAIVGGVASIILEHLFAEDPSAVSRLEPQLVELVLAPYLGVAEARRVADA